MSYIFWVDASNAAAGANGTDKKPFPTLQRAFDRMQKERGDVEVRIIPGVYGPAEIAGNFERDGSQVGPRSILVKSWRGEVILEGADPTLSVLKGFGVRNVTIDRIKVRGGKDGIQFGMDGNNVLTGDYCSNIVIQNCEISDCAADGVKISQADNVIVRRNTIQRCGDQGIDFLAVNGGLIEDNQVLDGTGDAAIFAKGGLTNVIIQDNYINGPTKDGITLGGWTTANWFRPDACDFEAKGCVARRNCITGVHKSAACLLGAVECTLEANTFGRPAGSYYWTLRAESGRNTEHISSDCSVKNNWFGKKDGRLYLKPGQAVRIAEAGSQVGTADLVSHASRMSG